MMSVPEPLLEVQALTVSLAHRTIVDGVSFQIPTGRTFALIGESGSGKSLTALTILGLLPDVLEVAPATRIALRGRDLPIGDDVAMRAYRGKAISIVFQDPMACLNPFMRVGAQIEEALVRLGLRDRSDRRKRLSELFREVELDGDVIARRYPHELSGGQQQRVMIAMALAGEPELLIADEATSALDASIQAEIVTLLKSIQEHRRMSMLFITHDLGVAAAIAHEVGVMRRGEIVERGTPEAILENPGHPYTEKLVRARRMFATPADHASGRSDELLSVTGLSVDYPSRVPFGRPNRAVHDASLTLDAGRTLGVLGESGSGKSTLAAAIAGFRRPSTGRVRILGHELADTGWRFPPSIRQRCQLVFQNPFGALNPRLTIRQQLAEPMQLAHRPPAEIEAKIPAALEEVGLEPRHAARYPHQLSGGQRQRVCIARALLCDPALLVCDEVVSALDMTVQSQVLILLKDLQKRRGFGMLFIGHDIEAVRWISDEIIVMYQGRIVDRFQPDDVSSPERDPYTRRLVGSQLLHFAA
jgi:peptide/nickel transport system ATP-binding protein